MATPPTAAVEQAVLPLPPGRALDIACGKGRHAIWLHQRGWRVTALDRDVDAIARLRADYPAMDARVIDLEQTALPFPDGAFDLVVCWLYFQRDLYPAMAAMVRPGGIAALSVLLEGRFAARRGEVRSYFEGWRVLHEMEVGRSSELIVQRPAAGEAGGLSVV